MLATLCRSWNLINVVIEHSTASSYGGALYQRNSSAIINLTNVVFSHDSVSGSYGGAIENRTGIVRGTNIVFIGCYGSNYGGAFGEHYSGTSNITTLDNVTVIDCGGGTAAIYLRGSSSSISNAVFWNNNGQPYDGIANAVSYSYSQIPIAGTGNITGTNPFINSNAPKGADDEWMTVDDGLELKCTSDAINAGSNAAIPVGITTDITGNPRISDDTVDMGAYESSPNTLSYPQVNIVGNATICQGDSTLLAAHVSGGISPFSYLWNTSATTDSITVNRSGRYEVTVTDDNGCKGFDSISVSVALPPNVTITGNQNLTAGQTDTLTAHGADVYVWSTGSINNPIMVSPTEDTFYSVIGTDTNGCSSTDTFYITIDHSGNGITDVSPPKVKVVLFPNPTNGEIHLKIIGLKKRSIALNMKIINQTGRVVFSKKVQYIKNEFVTLPINQLVNGIYFIKIDNLKLAGSKIKFVKK